jgi:hypothetical protein
MSSIGSSRMFESREGTDEVTGVNIATIRVTEQTI